MSNANRNRTRCKAKRKDGTACQGPATSSGYCIAHDSRAPAWRVMGGHATRKAERASKLLPARMEPTITLLEKTLSELYYCKMPIKLAEAMAQVGTVLVRVLQSAELGERVHDLETEVRALRSLLGNTTQGEKSAEKAKPTRAPQVETKEEAPRWVA
jgi:hypothetical protein